MCPKRYMLPEPDGPVEKASVARRVLPVFLLLASMGWVAPGCSNGGHGRDGGDQADTAVDGNLPDGSSFDDDTPDVVEVDLGPWADGGTDPGPMSLEIIPSTLVLAQAAAASLTAHGTFADGSVRDITLSLEGTSWESSDERIVRVSPDGRVLPLANGKVTITARNGDAVGTAHVEVAFNGEAELVRLRIEPRVLTLDKAGETGQLRVIGGYTDGSERELTAGSTGTIYQTGNSAVAEVSADGLLTARACGTTSLHVRHGEVLADGAIVVRIGGSPKPGESAGWVHGRVLDAAGAAVAGATVLVDGVVGTVSTAADGTFVFPVPDAPRSFRLTVEQTGRTYAHRTGHVGRGEHVDVSPIHLVQLDPATTTIGPEGGTHRNAAGDVELVVPEGATTEPVELRVTNLGAANEIPDLPQRSDFTYCVKLEPELAEFERSVTVRIANSLRFPPGTRIPVGRYSKEVGQWHHLGMATISSDGRWVEFATRHFSWCDANAMLKLVGDRKPTEVVDATESPTTTTRQTTGGEVGKTTPPPSCRNWSGSSQIGAADGRLQERHSLPSWRSLDRPRTVELVYNSHLAAPSVLLGFDYGITTPWQPETQQVAFLIAGQRAEAWFLGTQDRVRVGWRWDGTAADGTPLPTGLYPYTIIQGDHYQGTYAGQLSFGGATRYDTGVPGREATVSSVARRGRVALVRGTDSPFGAGWGLSGLQQLHLGDWGDQLLVTDGNGDRTSFLLRGALATIAGKTNGNVHWQGEGAAADEVTIGQISGVAVDAEGNTYVVAQDLLQVLRVDPAGRITTFLGRGVPEGGSALYGAFSGDGGPASLAEIGAFPGGLARDADGNLYLADSENGRLRRVDPSGTVLTVAGGGDRPIGDEPLPARQAELPSPRDVAVCPDGTLVISAGGRVLRLDGEGLLTPLATVPSLQGIDCAPDGAVYAAAVQKVWRLEADGSTTLMAGGGEQPAGYPLVEQEATADQVGDGKLATEALLSGAMDVAVGTEGDLFIPDRNHGRVRRVDRSGVISTIAGGPIAEAGEAGVLTLPETITVTPSGSLLVTEYRRVRRVQAVGPNLPIWTVPAAEGDPSTLSRLADGGYLRRWPDGTSIRFDDRGYQVERADRQGNRWTYDWQGEGDARRLHGLTDPVGQTTTFDWTAGRLDAIHDPTGRTTRFTIDAAGNLVEIENPDGTTRSFRYDAHHRLVEQTDASGQSTGYQYGPAGDVRQVIRADGSVRRYASRAGSATLSDLPAGSGTAENRAEPFPSAEQEESFIDASGRRVETQVNRFGTRTLFRWADGLEARSVRDASDRLRAEIYPSGRVVRYDYDAQGHVVRQYDEATGAERLFEYGGEWSLLTRTVDPLGGEVTIEYDEHGNPLTVQDETGGLWRWTYDAHGLVRSAQDPSGATTYYERDANGTLIAQVDPLGRRWQLAYDQWGNLESLTDPAGRTMRQLHDSMNRLIALEDPLGRSTRLEWQPAGGTDDPTSSVPESVIVAIVDPGNGRTTFEYDALHRRVGRVDPDGARVSLQRDEEGRLIQVVAADRQVTVYDIDDNGRRVARRTSDGTETRYAYGADGRIAQIVQDDRRIEYSYDVAGRLASLRTVEPAVGLDDRVEYSWDLADRPLARRGSAGVVNWERDLHGRMTAIVVDGLRIELGYDAAGRSTSTHYPDGSWDRRTYDPAGRPLTIRHENSVGASLLALEYGWDDGDLLVSRSDDLGEHRFTHDAAGVLTGVTPPEGSQLPVEWYAYDAAGNRIGSHRSTTYRYSDANRLLADDEGNWQRDAAGRAIARQTTDGWISLEHDAQGRLVALTSPTAEPVNYVYDLLGRRVARRDGATTVRYLYDGFNLVAELGANNEVQRRFVHGPGTDRPLLVLGNDGPRSLHADLIGSIRLVTGPDGAVRGRAAWDAFGNLLASEGEPVEPFGWTGRPVEPRLGLVDLRARFYDPGTGRFIDPDPLGPRPAEPNLYRYAGNDPLTAVDPFGLIYVSVGGQTGSSVVGGMGGSTSVESGVLIGTSSRPGCSGIYGYTADSWSGLVGEGAGISAAGSFTFSPFGHVEDFGGDSVGLTASGGLLGRLGVTLSVSYDPVTGQIGWSGFAINVSVGAEVGEELTAGVNYGHADVAW